MRPLANICEYPQFAGKSGGGGNRTRVGFTPETVALQELRWACGAAWFAEQPFLKRLAASAADLYRTPWEGAETGLYVVIDDQAAKFGISDDVFKRAEALQHATYRPLILYAAAPGAASIESWLHRELVGHRLRGEWFALHPEVLAVADTLLGIAQMCADLNRNECGPARAVDTLLMFTDDLEMGLGRAA